MKRIKISIIAQAIFVFMVVAIMRAPTANAADLNLSINKDGNVVQENGIAVGEVYHSWRNDILFVSLSPDKITSIQSFYTVQIQGNGIDINLVQPKLYAIHGAGFTLVSSDDKQITWSVTQPMGSQVTIVSEVKPGIFSAPANWRFLALLGRIPDTVWFILAIMLPILTLGLFFLRQAFVFRRLKNTHQLDPTLLASSPAALTVLYRGFVSRRATAATLIDLARRGHIQLLIRQDSSLFYRSKGKDELRKHEILLLDKWFGTHLDSRLGDLQKEIKRELINSQSTAINIAVYDEVQANQWFNPPPLITHWKFLITTFFITIMLSIMFIVTFITLQSATPLLWFWGGTLVMIAVFYAWAPTITHLSASGQQKLGSLESTKELLSAKAAVHPLPAGHEAWEIWLPFAMVLGIAPEWLKRWQNEPFKQPEWLLTDVTVRDFDQFLEQITPVLKIASESIRDKILPAYL